jgi:uncharacterized NAD(P)/FAD-binding protein YdhS
LRGEPPIPRAPEIVIVGGGLSGTLAAAELLARARAPLHVTIVDRSGTIGAGIAYGTTCPDHFLNVRAAGMSAVAGDPDHLVTWLRGPGRKAAKRWQATPEPETFLPRGLYAEYVRARLRTVAEEAPAGVRLDVVVAEGRAVEHGNADPSRSDRSASEEGAARRLILSDGTGLEADHVILALGHPVPRNPTEEALPFYLGARYVRDPWSEPPWSGLSPEATVLILGTNLTMIDLVVALVRRGHRGVIHAVSRHGLLPREHGVPAVTVPTSVPAISVSLSSISPAKHPTVRRLLRELRLASRKDADAWRAAIDAVRPRAQELWMGFSEGERRRFLRHARPYWEVHRHRAVPANLRDADRLRAAGQLLIHAGRFDRFVETDAGVTAWVRPRGGETPRELRVDRVLNATGPEGDYRGAGIRIVDRLFQDGMARPGPLGLGLDATREGALVDSSGRTSSLLSTLGPPLRGVLWETTAVAEIREQARRLAERLLGPQ